MKIANFRDYTAVLREIYSQEAMSELGSYYHALISAGKDMKKQKAHLRKKLYYLDREIKQLAVQIRQIQDKKILGLKIAGLHQQKQEQIKLLKDLQNRDHFNVLSEEAKVSLCSGFLLQKFLTRELLENNPLRFQLDVNGDLVVDTEQLRHSEIFQQAAHVRDFVATYLAQNLDKIKTPGHFKTLLNGINNWQGVIDYADTYFKNLNESNFLNDGPVKASRQGAEIIKAFPDKNLLLVQLLTEKALDYESLKMEHCVGKGSFDKGVKSGKTQIYSLREIAEDGEWLPHVTIEYSDGKIKQVKGFNNKDVPSEYRCLVRDAIFSICRCDDIVSLKNDDRVVDLKNFGYWVDLNGNLQDMYNLQKEASFSTVFQDDLLPMDENYHLISAEEFVITKKLDEKTVSSLKKLKKIGKLNLKSDVCLGDALTARQHVFSLIGSYNLEELSKVLDTKLLTAIGYAKKITDQYAYDNKELIFDVNPKTDDFWVDLTHLKEKVNIDSLCLNGVLEGAVDFENLICREVICAGEAAKGKDKEISRLAGAYDILFDGADFSGINEFDLSRLSKMYERQLDANNPLARTAIFLEDYTIPRMVAGCDVIFRKCRNLPPLSQIKFPSDVKHIMLEAAVGTDRNFKTDLPDFRLYKKLESLQINSEDLSENKMIGLPEKIKYLAFFKCRFGAEQNMDLSHFAYLTNLRLNECDLRGINNFVFPERLEEVSIVGAKFKKGIGLDFSSCKGMKKFNIGSWNKTPIVVGSLKFSESAEEICLANKSFPLLEELDLSRCCRLKKLNLEKAVFPQLRQLHIPKNCEVNTKGMIIANQQMNLPVRQMSNARAD